MTTDVKTTCAYCGVGCGIIARIGNNGNVELTGDKNHPANFGRLCGKGASLAETLSMDNRLLYPTVKGARRTWVSALNHVAANFKMTIDAHGPDAVAFYVSGQLLTEDYYVANKLMKGFIGSGNIDTNSRLCMASSVAGHKRAFGEDIVPGVYEDLELADLVVLIGSNLAWCHPVLHQRLLAAREGRGTKIVVIDPRETATSCVSDLHLALRPGSDVALFNGLLKHLIDSDTVNTSYIKNFCDNFDKTASQVQDYDVKKVSNITQLPPKDIKRFFKLFADHPATVSVYSQGVNQSSAGTDKVNAIINAHLATGRIGKPGSGPFSVTGQPNAMGGRETGGLANTLAAHIDFDDDVGHAALATYWAASTLATSPGLKAVDMFEEISRGKIKALWIMATNPVVSLSESAHVKRAIEHCDFVVVSDIVKRTDSSESAAVLLPAAGWGEKDGTVTNSERRISRQRRFIEPPGEAKPDWWIICEVAKRMGFAQQFAYTNPAAIFREYAAMTGVTSSTKRCLDITGLSTISDQHYDDLTPLHWPVKKVGVKPTSKRLFTNGRFASANHKARFIPVDYRAPESVTTKELPFILNTGRIRDQWHTMTRSINAPRLSAHTAEPYVELNPKDAERLGIQPAELVEVSNNRATLILRALVTERVKPGNLFVPMHWSNEYANCARVNELFPSAVDPISGQPELKFSAVNVKRHNAAWYGFALLPKWDKPPNASYWARMKISAGWQIELAGVNSICLSTYFSEFANLPGGIETFQSVDSAKGSLKAAYVKKDILVAAFFVSPEPVRVPRATGVNLLGEKVDQQTLAGLFTGITGNQNANIGSIICSCMSVDSTRIKSAIARGASTVRAVGEATGAGTNCGSCRMEIQQAIAVGAL